ncbi:MAG: lytic transglycosylase domain-containing protein [Desulfobacteraceae bacterium]|nr:lytic transglycosylase domain-containing protein [Desulfobacteraceae bacterium]
MKCKKYQITALLVMLLIVSEARTDELVPITRECIHSIATIFHLPVAALYGIFATEDGVVGKYSINTNKSRDNGPMQINSIWLEDLKKIGITEEELRNKGCLNVFVSAWILKTHLNQTGNIWEAIGKYHSKTQAKAKIYKQKVLANLITIKDYDMLLTQANKQVGIQQ